MREILIDQEFELPVKLIEKIKVIAKNDNMNKDKIVANAIRTYLSQKEKNEN